MGKPTDDLRLPTHVVAVELLRAGREPEHAELFASDLPGGRSARAAEVATLLENDHAFVPVREPDAPDGPRVALVGKQAIVWVAVPLGAPAGTGGVGDAVPDEVGLEPSEVLSLYDHRHDVRVELDVAAPITGHVLYSSPADRPRLVDHLNLPVRYLRVWTADALYLVNKHHLVRVLELD